MNTTNSLSYLMAQLQTALTANLFTTTTCFYSFDPMQSMNYPPSDTFMVIQPNNLSVKLRAFGGNTNVNYIWRWDFTLWLFVRLATDEAHRDTEWLSNQSYGSLVTVDNVINALQNYVFTDNGNSIGFELENVQWQNKDRPAAGWGNVRLKYFTDLNSRSN